MTSNIVRLITLFLTLMVSLVAHSELIWDELAQGDLSNSRDNPTDVELSYLNDTDVVTGTVGGNDPGEFEDVFTIDMFFGICLDQVVLSGYVPAGGNETTGFNLWVGDDARGNDDYLGSNAAGTAQIGSNLFAGLGPFNERVYTIEIRESTPGQLYRLDLKFCQQAFWTEAFDGDISSDINNPTAMDLNNNDNSISGKVGGNDIEDNTDAFSFVVPDNQQLTAINLIAYRASGSNLTTGFNLYRGTDANADFLYGSGLGLADVDSNFLTEPLPPGTYKLDISEDVPGQKYGLEFVFSDLSDLIFSHGFETTSP